MQMKNIQQQKKRKSASHGKKTKPTSKQWQLPDFENISKNIDALFRHRFQIRFQEVIIGKKLSVYSETKTISEPHNIRRAAADYSIRMEQRLAINCNFAADLYEDMATLLLYAISQNEKILKKYDPYILVSLDEEHLLPNSSIITFQRNREMRRLCFETLLKKLTADLAPDGHPLLQCRKCGGQADFNPVQIRSADEPMTIFCTCLNPNCKSQWKM